MASRHFKYSYESEIPPKSLFFKMSKANTDNISPGDFNGKNININDERNKIYFSRRKELKNLIKKVNSHLDNNSQSFFLALYYMDLIFTHPDLEKVFFSHFSSWNNYSNTDIQIPNYVLLSLSCLILASKFNENDPHVPTISSFIRLLYSCSNKKYIFNLEALYLSEIVVLKLLKYKLNYYTVYHYLIFFFTHGIIFQKTILNSKMIQKCQEKKILEKIYIQARDIIDKIIDLDECYSLYFGKDNYVIIVEIFLWCIEHIMNIKIKDDENIFKLIYNINIPEQVHQEIYKIIENINISNDSNKRHRAENNNKIFILNSNHNYKTKKIINSSRYPINIKSYGQYKNLEHKDKDFQFYNGLIHDELESFKSNYPYEATYHNNQHNQSTSVPKSRINYGNNNRVYLTSSKTIISFDSRRNNFEKPSKKTSSNQNLDIKSFKMEKEPIDNMSCSKNKNKNYTKNKGKIILINDNPKIRKKTSVSSSKITSIDYNYQEKVRPSENINFNNNIDTNFKLSQNKIYQIRSNEDVINNINYNNQFIYQNRPSAYTNNNVEKILKLDEKNMYQVRPSAYINNKIGNILNLDENDNNAYKTNKNKINLYNNYFDMNSYNKKVELNNEFSPIKNSTHKFYKNNVKLKNNFKNDIINHSKNLYNTLNLDSNLDFGPIDNKGSEFNKYFINSGVIKNIKNGYNKGNTIIINNNIHINTYIDKSKNIASKTNYNNKSPNIFFFDRQIKKQQ